MPYGWQETRCDALWHVPQNNEMQSDETERPSQLIAVLGGSGPGFRSFRTPLVGAPRRFAPAFERHSLVPEQSAAGNG